MFRSHVFKFSIILQLGLTIFAKSAFAVEPIELGEFMLELNVIDKGQADLTFDLSKISDPQSKGSFWNSNRVSAPAKLIYTSERNLRFIFNKPIVLDLKQSEKDEVVIQRLIPEVEIELAPRLKSHFEMLYVNQDTDLVATMDVLDYTLDVLNSVRELFRQDPSRFADGSFFSLPVIAKPLKEIKLPFIPLDDLLVPKPKFNKTTVEFVSLEVAQINSQTFQLVTTESRINSLAETMAGLSSHLKDTQDLVHFRSSAGNTRNQAFYTAWSRPETLPSTENLNPAAVLQFPLGPKTCRSYLRSRNSKTPDSEVLPFIRR